MIVANLPAPPTNYNQFYTVQLLSRLTALFRRCSATNEAQPFVTLVSPNGKSWDVVVDNTGALSTIPNTGHSDAAGGHLP